MECIVINGISVSNARLAMQLSANGNAVSDIRKVLEQLTSGLSVTMPRLTETDRHRYNPGTHQSERYWSESPRPLYAENRGYCRPIRRAIGSRYGYCNTYGNCNPPMAPSHNENRSYTHSHENRTNYYLGKYNNSGYYNQRYYPPGAGRSWRRKPEVTLINCDVESRKIKAVEKKTCDRKETNVPEAHAKKLCVSPVTENDESIHDVSSSDKSDTSIEFSSDTDKVHSVISVKNIDTGKSYLNSCSNSSEDMCDTGKVHSLESSVGSVDVGNLTRKEVRSIIGVASTPELQKSTKREEIKDCPTKKREAKGEELQQEALSNTTALTTAEKTSRVEAKRNVETGQKKDAARPEKVHVASSSKATKQTCSGTDQRKNNESETPNSTTGVTQLKVNLEKHCVEKTNCVSTIAEQRKTNQPEKPSSTTKVCLPLKDTPKQSYGANAERTKDSSGNIEREKKNESPMHTKSSPQLKNIAKPSHGALNPEKTEYSSSSVERGKSNNPEKSQSVATKDPQNVSLKRQTTADAFELKDSMKKSENLRNSSMVDCPSTSEVGTTEAGTSDRTIPVEQRRSPRKRSNSLSAERARELINWKQQRSKSVEPCLRDTFGPVTRSKSEMYGLFGELPRHYKESSEPRKRKRSTSQAKTAPASCEERNVRTPEVCVKEKSKPKCEEAKKLGPRRPSLKHGTSKDQGKNLVKLGDFLKTHSFKEKKPVIGRQSSKELIGRLFGDSLDDIDENCYQLHKVNNSRINKPKHRHSTDSNSSRKNTESLDHAKKPTDTKKKTTNSADCKSKAENNKDERKCKRKTSCSEEIVEKRPKPAAVVEDTVNLSIQKLVDEIFAGNSEASDDLTLNLNVTNGDVETNVLIKENICLDINQPSSDEIVEPTKEITQPIADWHPDSAMATQVQVPVELAVATSHKAVIKKDSCTVVKDTIDLTDDGGAEEEFIALANILKDPLPPRVENVAPTEEKTVNVPAERIQVPQPPLPVREDTVASAQANLRQTTVVADSRGQVTQGSQPQSFVGMPTRSPTVNILHNVLISPPPEISQSQSVIHKLLAPSSRNQTSVENRPPTTQFEKQIQQVSHETGVENIARYIALGLVEKSNCQIIMSNYGNHFSSLIVQEQMTFFNKLYMMKIQLLGKAIYTYMSNIEIPNFDFKHFIRLLMKKLEVYNILATANQVVKILTLLFESFRGSCTSGFLYCFSQSLLITQKALSSIWNSSQKEQRPKEPAAAARCQATVPTSTVPPEHARSVVPPHMYNINQRNQGSDNYNGSHPQNLQHTNNSGVQFHPQRPTVLQNMPEANRVFTNVPQQQPSGRNASYNSQAMPQNSTFVPHPNQAVPMDSLSATRKLASFVNSGPTVATQQRYDDRSDEHPIRIYDQHKNISTVMLQGMFPNEPPRPLMNEQQQNGQQMQWNGSNYIRTNQNNQRNIPALLPVVSQQQNLPNVFPIHQQQSRMQEGYSLHQVPSRQPGYMYLTPAKQMGSNLVQQTISRRPEELQFVGRTFAPPGQPDKVGYLFSVPPKQPGSINILQQTVSNVPVPHSVSRRPEDGPVCRTFFPPVLESVGQRPIVPQQEQQRNCNNPPAASVSNSSNLGVIQNPPSYSGYNSGPPRQQNVQVPFQQHQESIQKAAYPQYKSPSRRPEEVSPAAVRSFHVPPKQPEIVVSLPQSVYSVPVSNAIVEVPVVLQPQTGSPAGQARSTPIASNNLERSLDSEEVKSESDSELSSQDTEILVNDIFSECKPTVSDEVKLECVDITNWIDADADADLDDVVFVSRTQLDQSGVKRELKSESEEQLDGDVAVADKVPNSADVEVMEVDVPRNTSTDSGIISPNFPYVHPEFRDKVCMCGQPAYNVCRCLRAMYCSTRCQFNDWTSHRPICE